MRAGRRLAALAWLTAAAALVAHEAAQVDWSEVGSALRGYGASVLAIALPSYLACATYYLVPLLLAVGVYVVLEITARGKSAV